jgi:molybdenum cofactor cytidylyltransferase
MIAGLLLAAGGARRFKSQKLVALLDDAPIVHHSAAALADATDSLVVVVGHESTAVIAALADLDARVVDNPAWADGLATSLRSGIASFSADVDVDAVVVTLGDQPRIDPRLIRSVIAAWRQWERPIVSARYRGMRGHPVLFAREVFAELLALEGDAGARLLIERNPERVSYVDIDALAPQDVDTPDDLKALRARPNA